MRSVIADRLKKSNLQEPVPSILLSYVDNEEDESPFLGIYEREQIPTNDPIRYVDIDGIEFLLIQDWLCEDLDGKIIDVVNGRLTILDYQQP